MYFVRIRLFIHDSVNNNILSHLLIKSYFIKNNILIGANAWLFLKVWQFVYNQCCVGTDT